MPGHRHALSLHRHLIATFPWGFLIALGAGWLPPTASAQVLRCYEPATGLVTYTDSNCPKGQSATAIAPARSAAEIALDQERAQSARERWQAEQLRQRPPVGIPMETAPVTTPGERQSAACQAAQGELHALSRSPGSSPAALEAAQRQMEMQCLGADAYAALERSRANALAPGETTVLLPPRHPHPPAHRPAPPAEPIQRLNCNVFRCFDQHGNAMPAPRPGEVR